MKSLNMLKIGEEGIIIDVKANDNIKKRLLDIGFVKGARVKKVLISPGNDMVAYNIKGTVMALRCDDTKDIMVAEL